MTDFFASYQSGLESPARHLSEITPDDSTDLPVFSRALNVATSGFVTVTTIEGDQGSIFIAAGGVFPIRVTRIWATGTTATGIVCLC